MRYAYSHDEENYHGPYDTKQEAIDDGLDGGTPLYVGECSPPPSPASYFDIDDLLEHVNEQDDYLLDCADSWDDRITEDNKKEINIAVKRCIQRWLNRHGLNPKFFLVKNPERVDDPISPRD